MTLPNTTRKLAAVTAALAIAGSVGASAAGLGGLRSDGLAAASSDVEACDTDGLQVAYAHSFDPASCEGPDGDRQAVGGPALIADLYIRPSDNDVVGRRTWTVSFPAENLDRVAMTINGRLLEP